MKGTWLFDGTKIPTANGYVPVGDIKSGDILYSEFGNPISVIDTQLDFQILCKLTSPRITDSRLTNAYDTINIGTESLIMMKTYLDKTYSEMSISEVTASGILDFNGSDMIMKWSAKHGQGMVTPYVTPVGNINYHTILNMFSYSDFVIPDCYVYGSKMQKSQALDVLENHIHHVMGGYNNGNYYLQPSSLVLKEQLMFLIESLGHVVWIDGLYIAWNRESHKADTYFSAIDKLGYDKRVYGIYTDGHIPYQAGPFHTVVSSL